MNTTFSIVIVIIITLGLGGTLLRLQSQRKQSEVRQKLALERSELQQSVDKLKEEIRDHQKPK
jgi:ABC-type phosphate transport system auxiliary subunit